MAELPVTMSGLQPMVRAEINGKPARFIADTGAWFSLMSSAAAADYGLKLDNAPAGLKLSGAGGDIQPRLTTVNAFKILGVSIPRVEFLVGGSDTGSVGVLGQNFLAMADAEFDLAHGVIRIIRLEGCNSKSNLVYWAAPNTPYSEVETEDVARPSHIIAPVYVNGIKLRALFDTGASTSFISRSAASRLGLKAGSPGITDGGQSRGIGRRLVQTWIGPIQSVRIGDEEIRNTRIRFGGDFDTADMLVGADFFLSHRIFWSNKLHRLSFTFNGGHVFELGHLGAGDDAQDSRPATTAQSGSEPEPKDADGFIRRGAARAARGALKDALADLDQAAKLAPGNIEILRQRAELYARMRQPAKALDDLDHLLKQKADDVEAHIMRAALRRQLDHDADIRADLDAAATAASKNSTRRLELAAMYSDIDDYPQAIAQYDLWIAAHPEDSRKPSALNGRCWARALSGAALPLALKDCNAALSAMRHNPSFLDSRGLVRLRMGDFVKAIADYDEALAKDDTMAWSHYGRGIAELRLGRKDAGEADLAKARQIDPKLAAKAAKLGITP
jgi:tetratricopeptide (TPR) repeat protein/predicted aspartyl protease